MHGTAWNTGETYMSGPDSIGKVQTTIGLSQILQDICSEPLQEGDEVEVLHGRSGRIRSMGWREFAATN